MGRSTCRSGISVFVKRQQRHCEEAAGNLESGQYIQIRRKKFPLLNCKAVASWMCYNRMLFFFLLDHLPKNAVTVYKVID